MLRKHELLESAATIYGLLLEGKTDSEIQKTLGYDPETYQEVRDFLLESKADEARGKSREHVYIEYTLEQRRNISDLDALIRNLDQKAQYNAVVGAIRLRSDITDKIITRGQEFGLIKKQAERREIVAGLIVGELSSDDLRRHILDQTKLLDSVMAKYGEKDFRKLPEGDLHYGESAFDTEGESVDLEDDEELLEAIPPVKRSVSSSKLKQKLKPKLKTKAKLRHGS